MSAVDTHTVRLAQMVEAANGHADIPAALAAAGFTMSEITDNLFEVAERVAGLETLRQWQIADEKAQVSAFIKDAEEYRDGDFYA